MYWRLGNAVALSIFLVLAPFAVGMVLSGLLGITSVGFVLTFGSKTVFHESTELLDDLKHVVLVRRGFETLNTGLCVLGIFI